MPNFLALTVLICISLCVISGCQTRTKDYLGCNISCAQHQNTLRALGSEWQLKANVRANFTDKQGNTQSGRFFMRLTHEQNGMRGILFNYFGKIFARFETTANAIKWTDIKGKTIQASNASTLTNDLLGFPIPINVLADWLIGLDNTIATPDDRLDQKGHLKLRHEGDFVIEYLSYQSIKSAGTEIPKKLRLSHPNVTLTVTIQQFSTKQALGKKEAS